MSCGTLGSGFVREAQMEELNEMLADLADDGALDSEGVFTVSLGKAEEKLAAYRLTNPGLFVLNLVAAAVSSGASKLAVESYERETTFAFDPKLEYGPHDLEDIFTYILKPSAPAHLRELALALHGARALPELPVIILTIGAHGGQSLAIMKDQFGVRPAPDAPSGVRLRLSFPGSGVWAALLGNPSNRSQEVLKHLFHFCRFAPLKLTNNGQLKSLPVRLGGNEIFAWREIRGPQPMALVEPHGHYPRPESAPPIDLPSTILVGLGSTKTATSTGLLLISRGVTFKKPQPILGFPMACAAVTADHLEKNLSQSDLVEDAAYQELIETVQNEVIALVLDVCAAPPSWSVGQAAGFSRSLDTLYPPGSAVPAVVKAYRRSAAIEESCREPAAQAEQMGYWRELQSKDPTQAKNFAANLAGAVARQATRRLNNGEWPEGLRYLEDLYELRERPADAFMAVVGVLSEQDEKSRRIFERARPRAPYLLESLIGWMDSPGPEPLARFLQFEHAMDNGDLPSAGRLAESLLEHRGTAVLYLWLGWFAVFRRQHTEALVLWERALAQVPYDERDRWADILWPSLSGQVSFLQQVRWQARRAIETVQFSLKPTRAARASLGRSMHPARWAKQVWEARIRGASTEAHRLFVRGYLAGLINIDNLTLEELDSPLVPLAPFHSSAP